MRRIAAEPSLPAAALRYANLGIPVFPCLAGGKQPLTPNGFRDATSSARMVDHWWRRHPEANIGLPTGATTGVVVVDVDVHNGRSGYQAFERARAVDLADGWGWLVRTPSGGLHAYYPATPGLEQRCWQAPGAHVDFRGDGGYIIAPPSRIAVDGCPRPYVVIATAHHQVRRLDATALRQFLERPRRPPRPADLPPAEGRPEQLAAWLAARPEGARNAALFWAACRMVEHRHSYDDTLAVLGAAARATGLPDREIETTIRSAYRTAAPRPVDQPSHLSHLSRPSQSSHAGPPGPLRTGAVSGEVIGR